MHPYLLASLIVGGVAVVYATFLVFKELHEHTEYIHIDEKGGGSSQRTRDQPDDYDIPYSEEDFEEKGVLRRRKKSSKNNTQLSSAPTQSEDEQELLDRLSYLNAVEQEIERRKKALAEEERILREQEAQIEIRKQYIQSASSPSSSASDPMQKIPPDTDKDQKIAPIPKIQTESEILHSTTPDERGNVVSDAAAHDILGQHLSHISNQQQQQQGLIRAPPSISNSSVIDTVSEGTEDQNLELPTSRNQRLAGSLISEASWSEIGSVSEHQETISTGSEIDLDDVDAIEH